MGRHDHLEHPGALKKIDYPQLFSKVLHPVLIRKIETGVGKRKETLSEVHELPKVRERVEDT